MQTQRIAAWVVAGVATALLMAGCQVDSHKNGNSDNVKIATPFGGLQVKTNDSAVLADMGLPAYPGAQSVKKDNDNGAADVNMSFGSFQLRVKAASYRTSDPPSKVESFYRDGLKRYGDVIACRNHRPDGTPTRTFQGLTCDSDHEGRINVDDNHGKNELQLKTGSKRHQRIVSIEPEGGGTKFGLVVLDLPGKMTSDDKEGEGTE
jgi:hypothetical protein